MVLPAAVAGSAILSEVVAAVNASISFGPAHKLNYEFKFNLKRLKRLKRLSPKIVITLLLHCNTKLVCIKFTDNIPHDCIGYTC
jgi:hypothetical protein